MDEKRIKYLDLFGVQYPLCYTVQANEQVNAAWGNFGAWMELIGKGGDDIFAAALKMAKILMDGGRARVQVQDLILGVETELPRELSERQLGAAVALMDVSDLTAKLCETIMAGQKPTVETEPEKNGEATQ